MCFLGAATQMNRPMHSSEFRPIMQSKNFTLIFHNYYEQDIFQRKDENKPMQSTDI